MAARSGAQHHNAKLTNKKVRRIRERYDAGRVSQRELARQYHVSGQTIWLVVNNKSWTKV
jgi:DNA invertase Pin-like site-specific DNA recombinase